MVTKEQNLNDLIQLDTSRLELRVKKLVTKYFEEYTANAKPNDRLLTIDQACEFLNVGKQTIYKRIRERTLPHMKISKKLYFSELELLDYMKRFRVLTIDQAVETIDNNRIKE